MIVANLRRTLGRADAQLALRLAARGSEVELHRLEAALREEGLDAVLDDPRLLASLLETPRGAHASLPLFTYVVVRDALRRLGESDRMVADYLASLIVAFAGGDRAHRVADVDDEVYATLARLLADVDGPDARRTLLVRAHLGSYALWLSGLFPDTIEHRRSRRGGPGLDYYEELGRRGYRLAADHRLAAEHGLTPLFATAADRFAVMRDALTDVSDRLLFPRRHSPERILRQVRLAMLRGMGLRHDDLTAVRPATAGPGGPGVTCRRRARCPRAPVIPRPRRPRRRDVVFESIREALRDLWHGSRTPEERRAALTQMRETLVRARLGVDDLQSGISATRVRLAEERREVETTRRRKEMAERIADGETVAVAERFERQHTERVEVLERKLAAQEAELALVEREVTEMTREFKAAHAGIDPATVSGGSSERARQTEAEAEVDAALGGRAGGADELDAARRREARDQRDAQADAMLRALKQRLGRDE